MEDALLIDAHLNGDPQAMSVLMDRHRTSLMGFLRSRVGDDAEDLFQETWTRAAKALPRYTDQGTFQAWLFQIARRLVIDHYRRRSSRIVLLPTDETSPVPQAPEDPYKSVVARELSEATARALDSLSSDVAEVVRLRLIDNRPFKEIAKLQRVPLNTALGRMHRGLKQIRRALEADGILGSEHL
ncbi:MAG: RNA polymerase sigma factor [Myxococcota bacterium]